MSVRGAVALALTAGLCAQREDHWRGVLASPGGELPVLLSGVFGPDRMHHGAEVVRLSASLRAGVVVPLPPYDARLELTDGDVSRTTRGRWVKVTADGETGLPFTMAPWPTEADADGMRRHLAPTFPLPGAPLDVTGRWRVRFARDPHPAVAIFTPNPNRLAQAPGEIAGTFLTVTGDYRYLAGTARGDQVRLACFDGAHAFLFHATRQADGTLAGEFWSGATWHETWTATRDATAALPDAFTLTRADDAAVLADLAYPDPAAPEAGARRLGDLFGRATLVVLFGTWCPNCGDAAPFLRELLATHPDLRVIGLAFEHGDDPARHARVIAGYRERHGISWPILLAGPSDKAKASAALPAIDAVRAFPTTLFVDAQGKIRAVHQGFAGPATGAAHAAQRASFEEIVARLLERPR